jgi:DNA invertase Pin-like site-specific DNA recombinase
MSTAQGSTAASAAQYLRMSTEHQNYSLEAQGRLIAAYAEARGL